MEDEKDDEEEEEDEKEEDENKKSRVFYSPVFFHPFRCSPIIIRLFVSARLFPARFVVALP